MIFNSKDTKDNNLILSRFDAKEQLRTFIEEVEADLEYLKAECYQRHSPEYYEEVCYYNQFHKDMPQALLLSKCYRVFTKLYREEGKSLYEAVSAFLAEYELIKDDLQ